jgi:hypothetical protein
MWTMLDRVQQDAARAHVITERSRRGMSAREAARTGGITNTVWSKFEAGGNITPGIRNAVANAFGWPYSWPERLPELTADPVAQKDDIMQRLDELAAAVGSLLRGQADARQDLAEVVTRTDAILRELRPGGRGRRASGQ